VTIERALAPARKRFSLVARVSSDNPSAVKPVLERLFAKQGKIEPIEGGFEIGGVLEGETARDLNRALLSELRRAEKKTRLRAEWTSESTVEKFFDYVPKGTKSLRK
jgi:hypothetical protein